MSSVVSSGSVLLLSLCPLCTRFVGIVALNVRRYQTVSVQRETVDQGEQDVRRVIKVRFGCFVTDVYGAKKVKVFQELTARQIDYFVRVFRRLRYVKVDQTEERTSEARVGPPVNIIAGSEYRGTLYLLPPHELGIGTVDKVDARDTTLYLRRTVAPRLERVLVARYGRIVVRGQIRAAAGIDEHVSVLIDCPLGHAVIRWSVHRCLGGRCRLCRHGGSGLSRAGGGRCYRGRCGCGLCC